MYINTYAHICTHMLTHAHTHAHNKINTLVVYGNSCNAGHYSLPFTLTHSLTHSLTHLHVVQHCGGVGGCIGAQAAAEWVHCAQHLLGGVQRLGEEGTVTHDCVVVVVMHSVEGVVISVVTYSSIEWVSEWVSMSACIVNTDRQSDSQTTTTTTKNEDQTIPHSSLSTKPRLALLDRPLFCNNNSGRPPVYFLFQFNLLPEWMRIIIHSFIQLI